MLICSYGMETDFSWRPVGSGVHCFGVSSKGGVRDFVRSGVLATVYGFRHFSRLAASRSGWL